LAGPVWATAAAGSAAPTDRLPITVSTTIQPRPPDLDLIACPVLPGNHCGSLMPVTDCTDNRARRLIHLLLLSAVVTVLAFGSLAAEARGDGDPASDVLAGQSLFLPQDAGLPVSQQTQLAGLLATAQRDGFPIRAALIASPADLGSIAELWRQPETYAHFLGQELAIVYRGTLLVVMPNGYGVYEVGRPGARPAGLPGAVPGSDLGAAAIAAIRRLAAASGHTLPLPTARSVSGAGSGDTLPWIVFGIGLLVIVLAWTASLRARPLGSGGHRRTT
jgi:hypothetical protein